jgi:hypothetical protein
VAGSRDAYIHQFIVGSVIDHLLLKGRRNQALHPLPGTPPGAFRDHEIVAMHRLLAGAQDDFTEFAEIKGTSDPNYQPRAQELTDVLGQTAVQLYAMVSFIDNRNLQEVLEQKRVQEEMERRKYAILETIHLVLSVGEFIPIVQIPAGLINATVYTVEGRCLVASLSGLSAVPLIGYLVKAGKAVKAAGEGSMIVKLIEAGQAVEKVGAKAIEFDKPLVTLATNTFKDEAKVAAKTKELEQASKQALGAIESTTGTAAKDIAVAENVAKELPTTEKILKETGEVLKGVEAQKAGRNLAAEAVEAVELIEQGRAAASIPEKLLDLLARGRHVLQSHKDALARARTAAKTEIRNLQKAAWEGGLTTAPNASGRFKTSTIQDLIQAQENILIEINGELEAAKHMEALGGYVMLKGYKEGRGFDQIWARYSQQTGEILEYVVVEAKGIGATLAKNQMSKSWVRKNLRRLASPRSNATVRD